MPNRAPSARPARQILQSEIEKLVGLNNRIEQLQRERCLLSTELLDRIAHTTIEAGCYRLRKVSAFRRGAKITKLKIF